MRDASAPEGAYFSNLVTPLHSTHPGKYCPHPRSFPHNIKGALTKGLIFHGFDTPHHPRSVTSAATHDVAGFSLLTKKHGVGVNSYCETDNKQLKTFGFVVNIRRGWLASAFLHGSDVCAGGAGSLEGKAYARAAS